MNKHKKRILCALICSVISLGTTNGVFAEEKEFNFDEYIVTAGRIPLKVNEVAANVTVIANEDIEKGAYSKVSDILTANNVTMGTSSFASYPIINGDDRVLVMVDGRKMNWSHLVVSGNSRAVNIDNMAVKNIDHIEIVRGPNSALYGSDAVGGVINIITKKAKENNTMVTTEFGTWNARRYGLVTEGVDKDLSYVVTVDKEKRDNFDYNSSIVGKNREFNSSEIDTEHESLRIDKQLGNDNSLSLAIEHMKENNGYGLNLANVTTGVVYNPNTRRESEDRNVALTYSWNQTKGVADYFRIYQNNSEATSRYATSSYQHDLKATGAEWQQSWTFNPKYTLVGGAEIRKEEFDEISSGVKSQGAVTTSALFVENRWKLNKDLSLTVGSRYDKQSDFGDDVTSSVSLNKEVSPDTNVYLSWGQAVKNPTLKQRYANTPTWLGNKDLKQEQGETVTLGVNTKVSQDTNLQASIFSSHLKNSIAWENNVVGNQGMYVNVNREKRQGFELNATKKISDHWSATAGYSYSRVEKQNGMDSYALDALTSRPNGYSLGVKFNQEKWDAGLTVLAGTGRSTKAFTSDSYLTLDTTIGYQANKDTRVYLKGYNLTNQAYELISYSSTVAGKYPMAGRSFALGIEQRI